MPGLRQIPAHRTTPRLSIRKCSANRFALALSMQSQHKLLRSHVDPAGIHLEHPNLLRLRCPLRLPDPVTVSCRPCKFRLKRPRILFGIGEEGGGPVCAQAVARGGVRPARRGGFVCRSVKTKGAALAPPAPAEGATTSGPPLTPPRHDPSRRLPHHGAHAVRRVPHVPPERRRPSLHRGVSPEAGGASPSPAARGSVVGREAQERVCLSQRRGASRGAGGASPSPTTRRRRRAWLSPGGTALLLAL